MLVIHGLADTPATWAPMLNALRADEDIRRDYQFWFYSYPSGYPYPYSAAILRRELDGIEKRYPLRKPIVLIGHSMGSCISRLLITDANEKLWLEYFGKPPAAVRLSPETKQFLTEALIFRHRPEIGRVIFISGPHRGSEIASNWLGRFASRLVKSPISLLKVGQEAVKAVTTRGRLPESGWNSQQRGHPRAEQPLCSCDQHSPRSPRQFRTTRSWAIGARVDTRTIPGL